VYTPYGYDDMQDLPVVYVTDGHEYADDKLGAMLIVMDNLIHQNVISPIIAVFIDPREPGNTSNNRRMSEYVENINFANFVSDELVPQIDANYKTNPDPDYRAILGTSLGGWNSAFFGLNRSETFHLT
jgi:enterochelin esterase family protein